MEGTANPANPTNLEEEPCKDRKFTSLVSPDSHDPRCLNSFATAAIPLCPGPSKPYLAIRRFSMYFDAMPEKPQPAKSFENDPLFLEVMEEALAIQDRFSAEPVYAKTGKGYLKSVGVSEIQKAKEHVKQRSKETTP